MSKNSSSLKRVQVSLRNNLKNKIYKSKIKTAVKRALISVNNLNLNLIDQSQANSYLSEVYSIIDKAVNKGVIKKNKGSRQKSRLLKSLEVATDILLPSLYLTLRFCI